MQNPTSSENASPIIQVIASIIQFGIVGFVGSVPLGLITAFIYGPMVGREIWLLGAILMGSYFPLRSLIARIANQEGVINYIPGSLNLSPLVIGALGFLVMTPLLWILTFSALILGLVTYVFLQSILLAIVAALGLQVFNIYRQNQNTKSFTTMFNVNFQDLSQRFGAETLVLGDDDVEVYVIDDDEDREDTYLEEGVIYHLPEGEDRPVMMRDDDEEEIIIIDSDSDGDTQKQDDQ